MEKLINLRHLDISNTARLKMPLNLRKLKSLQVLVGAKFLVGGSKMEDLGEAQNLYGSLTVLELQNVVDRREVAKAKMREKNHVDKLSLEWSGSIADDSQTERDILDELRPHKNIKELEITGYRGTTFSNWVADPLFLKNCVKLCIVNCKNCYSLPALGQLPSLKFLSIREMDGITEVTEEFYGSSSSRKPFNSLEKLEFEDMSEWKQWHVLGNGEFPTLEYLSIKNCNSLTSLPFSILSSTLKTITISGCQKLKLVGPVGEIFLENLRLEDYDCIDDISLELLPRAHTLSVKSCPNLTRFFIPTVIESLFIRKCENVEKVSVACGNLPSVMTFLSIEYCSNLKRLPERMQELLPSLKALVLYNCPEIESFPEGGLPFNLQLLWIKYCTKLVNGQKEWRLQRLSCLRELEIIHDGSDEDIEHWELPCSIQRLEVSNLKTLSSQLLKSLTSLEYLYIEGNLPQIQSLGLCHLTSLQSLFIQNFPNLQSLSESALPSSLSKLYIYDCPNLQSFPVSGMASSLCRLYIRNCPLLRPQLEFDKGEYWPNIAQIPSILIDYECL